MLGAGIEMNKTVKLSIVIPVYNVEKYICQCLDSLINQSFQDFEIILIDDGSPDNCGKICDAYAKMCDKITVIHKQNGGVSAARNDGIKMATGEWIAFVDSDDWIESDYFENMFYKMPVEPVNVFCSGGYYREYSGNTSLCYTFEKSFVDTDNQKKDFLMAKVLAPQCGVEMHKNVGALAVPWNKLYRRSFLESEGIFFDVNLQPMEDTLFDFFVFSKAKGVAACDEFGYHYRKTDKMASSRRFHANLPQMFDVFYKKIEDAMTYPISELLQDALYERVMIHFIAMCRSYFFHPDNQKSHLTIVKEFKHFKEQKVVHEMVLRKSNRFMTKKQIVQKHFAKLPCMWPIALVMILNK